MGAHDGNTNFFFSIERFTWSGDESEQGRPISGQMSIERSKFVYRSAVPRRHPDPMRSSCRSTEAESFPSKLLDLIANKFWVLCSAANPMRR